MPKHASQLDKHFEKLVKWTATQKWTPVDLDASWRPGRFGGGEDILFLTGTPKDGIRGVKIDVRFGGVVWMGTFSKELSTPNWKIPRVYIDKTSTFFYDK